MLLIDCLMVSQAYTPNSSQERLTGNKVTVQGTDLYPPPKTWVPPNCIFTVDDVLKVNILLI